MKIKDFSLSERPRERLKEFGVSVLSDSELLAIILKVGSKNENVIDMSKRLIASFGLSGLSDCSLKELMNFKGVGFAKACQLLALFEISKRIRGGRISELIVRNPSDVASHYMEKLFGLKKEHLYVVLLDTKGTVIKDELVSVGTLNSSLVHAREVFGPAIRNSANSVILVHNHPSGNSEPSEEDIYVTKELLKAAKHIGINLLDHIIVGNNSYWSYNDENGI